LMYGPSDTWSRLGAASSPYGGEIDDFSDIFDVRHWVDGEVVKVGAVSVLPRVVCHPTESFGLRITNREGASFVYSGDTGFCDTIIDLARGADVFLCEASWTHSPDRPPNLHLSGTEAGRIATAAGVGELLLTHIPPWTSREDVISEAKAEFGGPVHAVVTGETFNVGRS
jgi:ribonuclease BN (tRNA processing enzyme)